MTMALGTIIATQTAMPVHAAITAMATALRDQHRGVVAILAYGSMLRDVQPDDGLIDLYVLTEGSSGISTNALARMGCALVPPNVYYAECRWDAKIYRAKYAVVTLAQFQRGLSPTTSNPYFWARFSQPCRIVFAASEMQRATVQSALATAAATAFANALSLHGTTSIDSWVTLFQNTYRTELRPESPGRAAQVVAANAGYYTEVSEALQGTTPIRGRWAMRRAIGKGLSILRLAKAAFTFQGGADYIAWKIKRHSGVEITVTAWQRRHPLLAGLALLPQLLRKGAVK